MGAREDLQGLWDCVGCVETKRFLRTRATEHALAFVYKRSFMDDILNCKRPVLMPLIGYARVSTEDQHPLPQSQALNPQFMRSKPRVAIARARPEGAQADNRHR